MIGQFKKSDPLLPVDYPHVFAKYHVAWGTSNGVVGKVLSVNEEKKTVKMCSPKTGIEWKNPVKWSDLRHLRKTQLKMMQGKT